jgi:hypothetical protein
VTVKIEARAIKEEPMVEQEPDAPGGSDTCDNGDGEDIQLKFDKDGFCIVYIDGQRLECEEGVRFGLGVWFGRKHSL